MAYFVRELVVTVSVEANGAGEADDVAERGVRRALEEGLDGESVALMRVGPARRVTEGDDARAGRAYLRGSRRSY